MPQIILNVTCKVLHTVSDEWLQWLHNDYAPAIIQTGCFKKYIVLKLRGQDDSEGPTYAIQFFAENDADFDLYTKEHAHYFEKAMIAKWRNQAVSFSTVLEVVG